MDNESDEGVGTSYMPPENWRRETFIETYKSQIAIVIEGLKLLALANGGAAVALLTYLGSDAVAKNGAPNLVQPMSSFVWGLVACMGGFFASYLSQMFFLKLIATKVKARRVGHFLFFIVAASAIVYSLWCFKELNRPVFRGGWLV
jgi:hypothetical protein